MERTRKCYGRTDWQIEVITIIPFPLRGRDFKCVMTSLLQRHNIHFSQTLARTRALAKKQMIFVASHSVYHVLAQNLNNRDWKCQIGCGNCFNYWCELYLSLNL
jgi:hypothetical protein